MELALEAGADDVEVDERRGDLLRRPATDFLGVKERARGARARVPLGRDRLRAPEHGRGRDKDDAGEDPQADRRARGQRRRPERLRQLRHRRRVDRGAPGRAARPTSRPRRTRRASARAEDALRAAARRDPAPGSASGLRRGRRVGHA